MSCPAHPARRLRLPVKAWGRGRGEREVKRLIDRRRDVFDERESGEEDEIDDDAEPPAISPVEHSAAVFFKEVSHRNRALALPPPRGRW